MKYLKIALIVTLSCLGVLCSSKRDLNFKVKDISVIEVYSLEGSSQKALINSSETIKSIFEVLESGHIEMIKFKPDYKMVFINDGKKWVILFNDRLIKIDGVSYKVDESLYKLLWQ